MKNLDKLLSLETITRKDLMAEGFNDYEIKKLVLEGVIEKTGRGIYASKSNKEKSSFEKLVISFNNHDSEAVAKIYDGLSDKDKYNGDIIKLLLVSLARIENILNSGYQLQSNVATLEKTVELDEVVDSHEDNISLEPLEESKEDVEEVADLEIPEEVESDFDIDLFLDNLYCEFRNAIEDRDYYRARDILFEYNYYCREYDIDDDCFHDLFILNNKIASLELDIDEKDTISFLIREIKRNFINGRLKNDGESVKRMLNEFGTLPSSNNIYYYHRYKADYLMNVSSYNGAIKEYEKAIEINPYNKHDYYKLALLHFINMKSKDDCKKGLKLMDNFIYYSRNTFTPNQLSLLANIYVFNFMGDRAIEILENAEEYDEEYKRKFFKQFGLSYMRKYDTLKRMKYSTRENEKDFAEPFFENDYLDIFTKYALIYSGNFEDVFNEKGKHHHQELEIAKAIVDSDSITKFSDLDDYLLKLDLSDENKADIMLDIAVYLTEKGFYDKASKYLKMVEIIKNKSDSIKDTYKETLAKIKVRKIANKTRR